MSLVPTTAKRRHCRIGRNRSVALTLTGLNMRWRQELMPRLELVVVIRVADV